MKMLFTIALLALLAVPVASVFAVPQAEAKVLVNPDQIDGFDRRGGRCFSREGSACGGV